jgi:hypothetical protein
MEKIKKIARGKFTIKFAAPRLIGLLYPVTWSVRNSG